MLMQRLGQIDAAFLFFIIFLFFFFFLFIYLFYFFLYKYRRRVPQYMTSSMDKWGFIALELSIKIQSYKESPA